MTREDEIRERLVKATPGPWERGNRFLIAGCISRFGKNKCAYCTRHGRPIWTGRRDINGIMMQAHVHFTETPWSESGIYHYDGDGGLSQIVVDTEEYGLVDAPDAILIANAPSDLTYLLDQLAALQARVDAAVEHCSNKNGLVPKLGFGREGTAWAQGVFETRDELLALLTNTEQGRN